MFCNVIIFFYEYILNIKENYLLYMIFFIENISFEFSETY